MFAIASYIATCYYCYADIHDDKEVAPKQKLEDTPSGDDRKFSHNEYTSEDFTHKK